MKLNVSRRLLVTVLAVYLVDVFWAGQGVIAGLAFLVGVFILLAGLWSMVSRNREKARERALTALLLMATAVLAIATISANNHLAAKRFNRMIAACEQYHARHNKYPDQLEQLVPEFLPSVPVAKYTMMFNTFSYWGSSDHHTIMYVAFPPFGRPYYVFEEHRWGYLD